MRLSLALVASLAVVPAAAAPLSAAEIAERATASVVLIKVPNGVGSGFVAGAGGRIATNLHVIRAAEAAVVVTADGKRHEDVEVMAVDEQHDLVVLRIDAPGLKALPLGRSAAVKPGQHVVAIGHPLGLGNTVSDGLVSAVREISAQLTVLQISAPISPGSSGGPLFNDAGEVIGIATLVATGGQNLNFAVPIDALKPLLAAAKGTPIAEFAASSAVRRHVPHHPVSILDGCPAPQLRSLIARIEGAIEIGAPLYNEGNLEACYRIYSAVALEAEDGLRDCAGPRQALLEGLSNAEKLPDWGAKAWAMRDAFDGLLEVAERFLAADAEPHSPQRAGFKRNVPRHPEDFLSACPAAEVSRLRDGIGAAIQSGAPLYNAGNVEACFRIYEGAARELERKLGSCPPAENALREGLRVAGERRQWADKAWALRDAFDGLLQVLERN